MDGNALQALERDILAALELDEVLLAVDDGEQAVFGPLANVARHEPAVVVERLGRQVRALVCARVARNKRKVSQFRFDAPRDRDYRAELPRVGENGRTHSTT